MLTIQVAVDVSDTIRELDRVQRLIPSATALALNRTAQAVKDDERKEMVDVFDRPKPYTLNSIKIDNANSQTLTAAVYLRNDSEGIPAAKYLRYVIAGGFRSNKRFEKALRARIGADAFPEDMLAVPGSAAKLDAYGNLDPGIVRTLLSYFGGSSMAGVTNATTAARKQRMARGTRKKRGVAYFVGRPGNGKLPLGVWQRVTQFARQGDHASVVKPILIFVDGASYEAIYDFPYVARKTVEREWGRQFASALQDKIGWSR